MYFNSIITKRLMNLNRIIYKHRLFSCNNKSVIFSDSGNGVNSILKKQTNIRDTISNRYLINICRTASNSSSHRLPHGVSKI